LLPFYIGETLSVYNRLRDHLRNVDIVDVLRGNAADTEIRNGARYFHVGYLKGKFNKENTKKRLEIVQRYMIRAAMQANVPILNKNLTKISTHEIGFIGSPKGRAEYPKRGTAEAK
jgi:hypothetical protein